MKPLIYHDDVLQEIGQAAYYYELHRIGLGEKFKHAILDAEEIIAHNPMIGAFIPHKTSTIRKYPLYCFPYTIFYCEYPDRIFIIAIAHDSRKPGYWGDRIE